eukprot:TRINITY_DN12125_c0_g1_i1.p1 TRINITY_DN12125_c0_g1~~TRINITY_DN12125_c0_g1_i1.p1  ORF type:complete len:152 (+),score=12.73 TRINITY_DN12125_c0_g1_i1:100-555(+)
MLQKIERSQVVREVTPSDDDSDAPSTASEPEAIPPAAVPTADKGQAGVCEMEPEASTDDDRRQADAGDARHWRLLRDSVRKDHQFLKTLKDDNQRVSIHHYYRKSMSNKCFEATRQLVSSTLFECYQLAFCVRCVQGDHALALSLKSLMLK